MPRLGALRVLLGATPEPSPPHTPEPEEGGSAAVWPFILLSVLVFLSIVFDICKESVEHSTPDVFEPIVEAFFSELATLGFIGALAFLLTYNFNPNCEGTCTVMQQLSEHFLGEPNELQEIFEGLHFLLFFVSVLFIFSVLVDLNFSLRTTKKWEAWEFAITNLRSCSAAANEAEEATEGETLLQTPKGGWATRVASTVNHAQNAIGSKLISAKDEVLELMSLPKTRFKPGTLMSEWTKSEAEQRAEYYRFRHRFIDDEEEAAELEMPHDFDYGMYLKLSLAETFAEIIEIKPIDWVVLWACFGVIFVCTYFFPYTTVVTFLIAEVVLCSLSFALQMHLVHVRHLLLPDINDEVAAMNFSDSSFDMSAAGKPMDTKGESGNRKGLMSERTGVSLKNPRYMVKCVSMPSVMPREVKSAGFFRRMQRKLHSMFRGRTYNRHQRLFWFCSQGPGFIQHASKLCLFGSNVCLAVIAAELSDELMKISLFLLIAAIIPPVVTLLMMPHTIQIFNLVTAIETMKQNRHIQEVIKSMKLEKQKKAFRVLTSIQFFLEKAEDIAPDVGDEIQSCTQAVKARDVAKNFKAIKTDKQTMYMLSELETLFKTYDVNGNGTIDREELSDLMSCIGQPKSADELERLFNLMDADGSGDVDFEEFATVILHNRNCKHTLDTVGIADRMWKMFDNNDDGTISPAEMLDAFRKLGSNWDMVEVKSFLDEIDMDGNGTIEKEEFIEYVKMCYGSTQSGHGKGHGHGGHGGGHGGGHH